MSKCITVINIMSKPLIPPNLSSRAITGDMAKGYKRVEALSNYKWRSLNAFVQLIHARHIVSVKHVHVTKRDMKRSLIGQF